MAQQILQQALVQPENIRIGLSVTPYPQVSGPQIAVNTAFSPGIHSINIGAGSINTKISKIRNKITLRGTDGDKVYGRYDCWPYIQRLDVILDGQTIAKITFLYIQQACYYYTNVYLSKSNDKPYVFDNQCDVPLKFIGMGGVGDVILDDEMSLNQFCGGLFDNNEILDIKQGLQLLIYTGLPLGTTDRKMFVSDTNDDNVFTDMTHTCGFSFTAFIRKYDKIIPNQSIPYLIQNVFFTQSPQESFPLGNLKCLKQWVCFFDKNSEDGELKDILNPASDNIQLYRDGFTLVNIDSNKALKLSGFNDNEIQYKNAIFQTSNMYQGGYINYLIQGNMDEDDGISFSYLCQLSLVQ